ncbi:uncharacterized protein RHIMIDRAFT_310820 [Rhizopus microsporus ATCC 52813]|uniref:RCC1-like domain-containing protein n=1 Tax=Rhizopus microsporus ATCC 52813 TaxID=1340429 RepID=A0A2G4T5F7_RHIZD|nr:uncharacterized protein RHIMIDRAFT_310820 [Rhizopus microsporus ATCC 52813]PHZ16239.1 hypothetical protein RHIMIDRAFT_310820 [Rhizopus microsporus ATCC 52813]
MVKRKKSSAPLSSKLSRKRTTFAIPRATEKGKLFTCGSNDASQLGMSGDVEELNKLTLVESLKDKEFTDVVCGGMHSIAIDSEGAVLYSWGCNDEGALGRQGEESTPAPVSCGGATIVKVACGDNVSMGLTEDGQIYSWGTYRGNEGTFGFSIGINKRTAPMLHPALGTETVIDIAAGANHSLALTNRGRVYAWGYGAQGQLARRISPRFEKNWLRHDSIGLKKVKLIGAGSYHSLAVTTDNKLYAWGLNNYKQCCDDERQFIFKPILVPLSENFGEIVSVQGGEHHTLILTKSGEVYAYGRGDAYQLGLQQDVLESLKVTSSDSAFRFYVPTPTLVSSLEKIVSISVGPEYGLACSEDGRSYCWGYNSGNAIGNGSDRDEPTPRLQVFEGVGDKQVLRLSAGGQHSLCLAKESSS